MGSAIHGHVNFETVRIRLTDFLTNGTGLDLTDIAAVRFDFGSMNGSVRGRIGFDALEIHQGVGL